MFGRVTLLGVALVFLIGPAGSVGDKPISFDTLGAGFARDVRPLLSAISNLRVLNLQMANPSTNY